MSKKTVVKKKEGIKSYTGARVNNRTFKRYLATAKTPEERAAIKSFVLGDDVQYYGKDGAPDDSADS